MLRIVSHPSVGYTLALKTKILKKNGNEKRFEKEDAISMTLKAKIGDQSCSEIEVGGFRSAWDHGGWVSSQRGWLQLSVGRVWSWGRYDENSVRRISDLAMSSYGGGEGGKLG